MSIRQGKVYLKSFRGDVFSVYSIRKKNYNFERELYLSLFVEEISRHTVLNFQIFPIIINPLNDCAIIDFTQQKNRHCRGAKLTSITIAL